MNCPELWRRIWEREEDFFRTRDDYFYGYKKVAVEGRRGKKRETYVYYGDYYGYRDSAKKILWHKVQYLACAVISSILHVFVILSDTSASRMFFPMILGLLAIIPLAYEVWSALRFCAFKDCIPENDFIEMNAHLKIMSLAHGFLMILTSVLMFFNAERGRDVYMSSAAFLISGICSIAVFVSHGKLRPVLVKTTYFNEDTAKTLPGG